MKILHTADWHLGKYLEGHSRLDEQKKFVEEIDEIARENEVDLILICGDIYDTFNPPAEAEKLFYHSLKKLANRGERTICIISGNHDSPHRLMASYPLAYEQGIIILGNPLQNNGSIIDEESLGKHKLVDGGQGYLELSINGERAVILTLPYPSESRLNQVLTASGDERELQQNYSGKVGQIFNELQEHYRKDTINLAVSHLFVAGGRTSQSERSIQIGGGYRVFKEDLPEKSQYTALGHLHKNQPASRSQNAYYSGSPLQYSLSERDISKSVTLIDLGPDSGKPEIAEIKLKNRKPIELWEVEGIEKAVKKCRANQDREVWAYLKIKTDKALLQGEIKKIKNIKPDILSIIPEGSSGEDDLEEEFDFEEKGIRDLFKEYYRKNRGVEPEEKILKMFSEIVSKESD